MILILSQDEVLENICIQNFANIYTCLHTCNYIHACMHVSYIVACRYVWMDRCIYVYVHVKIF